ncbi:hypothetical protein A4A49_61800, partial [Nicotiana attenuata]
ESSDEEVEQEEQSVNNNGKEQQLVGNTNKDKQKQVDRPVTNMDGDGIQLIHRDVPPDKSTELQLTEMQHEVRVENIGVSTSIQSCDMAPVKGDIQLTHLIHKDQDKGNALVGKEDSQNQLAEPRVPLVAADVVKSIGKDLDEES